MKMKQKCGLKSAVYLVVRCYQQAIESAVFFALSEIFGRKSTENLIQGTLRPELTLSKNKDTP